MSGKKDSLISAHGENKRKGKERKEEGNIYNISKQNPPATATQQPSHYIPNNRIEF